jgi:serine/threonine protein kinase
MTVRQSNEIFARKIIPINISALQELHSSEMEEYHPDNEVRVVRKFEITGSHENIVSVLKHGWLEENLTYFFDMERCALTLDAFIRFKFRERLGLAQFFSMQTSALDNLDILSFWSIVNDVTNGLNYIHQLNEIHRDMKPSNGKPVNAYLMIVFLSLRHNKWQVADFGLTEPGTSKVARYTIDGRGSEGYRAPEMYRGNPVVSKQADIFSLGCIIYELASGRRLRIHEWRSSYWSSGSSNRYGFAIQVLSLANVG